MENLIKIEPNRRTIQIGNIAIETNYSSGNAGYREIAIQSKFKNIFSISLVGNVNYGQTQEYLMRQVVLSSIADIIEHRSLELYSAGNQTILITVIGEI